MEQFDKICEVQSDKASVEVSYVCCLFCFVGIGVGVRVGREA